MKYTRIAKRSFLLCIVILASLMQLSAQNVAGIRSKNKVMIGGTVYYIHIVQPNETLTTISQLYTVSEKTITDENPEALAGVHEGQVLKIPEVNVQTQTYMPMVQDTGLVHIVKPGETLYSISRLYNITVKDLYTSNPEVQNDTIEVNQVLKIPRNRQTQEENKLTQTQTEPGYIVHKVEPRQTLFSLARQYKVSMDDIRKANLVDGEWKGLKAGEMLRIPVKSQETAVSTVVTPPVMLNNQPVVPHPDTVIVPVRLEAPLRKTCNCDSIAATVHNGPIKIAMFLPFGLDKLDLESQLDTLQLQDGDDDARQQEVGNTATARNCSFWTEFYQGSLLAVDKLRKQGISIQLAIYDSENEPAKFAASLLSMQRFSPGLIIAAGDTAKIEQISGYSKAAGVPLVLPVGSYQNVLGSNPGCIALEPSDTVEMNYIMQILQKHKGENFVIIQPSDSSNLYAASFLESRIRQELHPDTDRLHNIMYTENSMGMIANGLRDSINNVAIVLIRTEALTGDAVRSLNVLSINHSISLIGLHEWSKFNSVDIEHLHHLELRYFIPFDPDYTNAVTKDYLREFVSVNHYYPYRISKSGYNYGMHGFDLMQYFVPLLQKYQTGLPNCLPTTVSKTLNGFYLIQPIGQSGGMENKYELLVHFTKDYGIEKEVITR